MAERHELGFLRFVGRGLRYVQTSGHLALRQVARAQRKGLNFPVFVGEKCAFCEPLSFSELLEFNDWQNAATSCPAVPNDLLERELFYCTHRCSRARTSRILSEVLKSDVAVLGTLWIGLAGWQAGRLAR